MTTDSSVPQPGARPDTPPHASSAPASSDQLRRHLRSRLERHVRTEAFRPALTIVGFRGDVVDVLRHGTDRPEEAVLELVLPSEYSAVGVLASSVVSTPPGRSHSDAALAIGVPRSGNVVSLLATNDRVVDTKGPQGWLIDACLRSVQRPTAPCQIPALEFPIALWLDRLMVAIVNAPTSEPVTWTTAVRLCPVPRRWRSDDAVELGGILGSTTQSWGALRTASAQGLRAPVDMTPDRARWMDDAMFARWCMGSFPDLASLRGDVEFLAPAEVAQGVEVALRFAWLAFAG
ncbi:MAG: hypothetical protein ACI88C_000545 [Acidimicrobiales bacterium]|jgi:hypothetical protein